ncbi:hypothetical protein BDN70DRAFT_903594 [Pholiota conissans]|uniref:Uncharacterized protein n=1 Tax=Pholiota conissans TaxID=109636 RepID=A0A9P6D5K4_9AGAR|nr:hypothetical protein BDN70DRAFT_903594 [Pholiota conissans]
MTDLTVLVSPLPLYPDARDFPFVRRPKPYHARPIMVTLETEKDEQADAADEASTSPGRSLTHPSSDPDFINPLTSPPRRSRTPIVAEPHLLSPPVNTWKSRPRHRPTRSQSAPPERRTPSPSASEGQQEQEPVQFNAEALGFRQRNPNRSFTSFTTIDRNSTRGGELVRPPPPLLRPTTFWRKTRRSGVTGASYSPASHLIRRSTYIAAGLSFDAPIHDLSALCVESRVGFIVIPPVDQTLL